MGAHFPAGRHHRTAVFRADPPSVNRHHNALVAHPVGRSGDDVGREYGGCVYRALVGAGPQHRDNVVGRSDAAADRQWYEDLVGRATYHIDHRRSVVRASRNIEEDQLIGSLMVVKGGQLDRVAGIAQVEELGSLDDAAIGYIEAGDDTFGEQITLNFGLFHGNRLCRLPPAHQGMRIGAPTPPPGFRPSPECRDRQP